MLIGFASPAAAISIMIGDNDGYGVGICDNCNHNFVDPIDDNREASEVTATDGAQYTDTFSTTHGEYSPADQTGDLATFLFTGLGNAWTIGHLEIDMADFQSKFFFPVIATFNGIVLDFDYHDGYPRTRIHFYPLTGDVLDSINATGELEIVINRNGSDDYYGFDYLSLNDSRAPAEAVPEPASMLLLGGGLAAAAARRLRRKK